MIKAQHLRLGMGLSLVIEVGAACTAILIAEVQLASNEGLLMCHTLSHIPHVAITGVLVNLAQGWTPCSQKEHRVAQAA